MFYFCTVDVWSLGCLLAEVMFHVYPPAAYRVASNYRGVLFRTNFLTVVLLCTHAVMKLCGVPSDADVADVKCGLLDKDANFFTLQCLRSWLPPQSATHTPSASTRYLAERRMTRKTCCGWRCRSTPATVYPRKRSAAASVYRAAGRS